MKRPFRQPLFWSTGRRPDVPIDQLKIARADGSAIGGSKRNAARHWFYRALPSPLGIATSDR